jgi:thioredoxin 1
MTREIEMTIPHVVDREFKRLVLQSDKPTLVAFRASWCLPSQDLVPIIDEVADNFGDQVQFVAVDAEGDTKVILRKYKVNRLPVIMLFDDGRCVDVIGGFTSKDVIVQMLEEYLKPVKKVDEINFDAEVLQSQIPVLVHFDASWCRPSQLLIPVVDEIAQEFKNQTKVVRVDFGPDTARLCSRWGVSRVPTLALFVDGQIEDQILGGLAGGSKVGGEVRSCVGLTSSNNIAEMLKRVVL